MKSKLIFGILLVFIGSSVFVTSCKYDEGPNISLRTKMSRITGQWGIQEIHRGNTIINANNIDLSAFSGILEEILDSLGLGSLGGFDLSNVKVSNPTFTLSKDGTGSVSISVALGLATIPMDAEPLTWEFREKKEDILINVFDRMLIFDIERLANDELWLSIEDTSDIDYKIRSIKS